MATHQEFVRDGHYCEFNATLLPAVACDPTHERDHIREVRLSLRLWDGPERTSKALIQISKSAYPSIDPDSDALEAEVAQQREQIVAEALDQVACIRDARKLEHKAEVRLQEFLEKPA